MLRTLVLAFDHDPARNVGDANRRISFVDMLTAGAGRTISVDAQVSRIDGDFIDLIEFGQNGYRARRGVNATLRFGRRNTLYAMRAGFELKMRVGALTHHATDNFLVATVFAGTFRHHLDTPTTPF